MSGAFTMPCHKVPERVVDSENYITADEDTRASKLASLCISTIGIIQKN